MQKAHVALNVGFSKHAIQILSSGVEQNLAERLVQAEHDSMERLSRRQRHATPEFLDKLDSDVYRHQGLLISHRGVQRVD